MQAHGLIHDLPVAFCSSCSVRIVLQNTSQPVMASSSSSAGDRFKKLKSLNELRRRCPHMTASALAEVLADVAEHGVPDLHARGHIAESAANEIEQHNAYGPLISGVPAKLKDIDDSMEIIIANPLTLLQAVCGQGGSYHDLLKATAQRHNKLSAIIYFDEVVPGDPLGYANRRKVWVSYLSFKEFGPRILSNEAVWLPLIELRTSETSKLSAGISQVCKIIMHSLFLNPICDVLNLGVLLRGPGERFRFRICLAYILQDGAAHKYIFCTKGDNGCKMCLLCRNLVAMETEFVDEDTGDSICTASVTFEHECDLATDSEIRGTIERLKARHEDCTSRRITAGSFANWQKAIGLNFQPDGLLMDSELLDIVKPTEHYMHDWMHTLFVVGVFHTVTWLLLTAIKDSISQWSMVHLFQLLHDYVSMWVQPSDKGGNLKDNFTPKRLESNKRAKNFKCKASDGLGMYSIIGLWLMFFILPTGKCQAECQAFLCMCDMIDLLLACSQEGHGITPGKLSQSIHKFLKSCVDAGWKHRMHPKFHWLVHFPTHLRNHGFLVSCFVHERLHKLSKRYGTDIRNTRTYEVSLLKQVLCQVLADLREPGLFDTHVGLKTPKKATKKALEFLSSYLGLQLNEGDCKLSNAARVRSGSSSRKDIVLVSNPDHNFLECGEVWMHAEVKGNCISLVSMWSKLDHDKPKGLMTWQKADNPMFLPTHDILCAVVHRSLKDNAVSTILPVHLR
jgi:hypothetical protein